MKHIKEPSAYEHYLEKRSEEETKALNNFFIDIEKRLALSKKENHMIQADFEKALIYYDEIDVPINEALHRLSPENLSGFYVRPPIHWYSLDAAAKIYPLSMKHGQMAVFRLSVYLKNEVIPELLQIALTFTIKRFKSFATTVKKGFFWHYLDASKRRYAIEAEVSIPCQALPIAYSGSQSFRVLYYKNRISVEYFHILTDGSGGMTFLKTLTAEYLRLLGIEAKAEMGILPLDGIPTASETTNEFTKAEKIKKNYGFMDKPSVQMSGHLSRIKPCRILHFKMDAEQLRQTAKKKNTTVTTYLLSLIFTAGKHATDELKGDFSIQVPVNMRKFFTSDTLRNFSMYCGIRLKLQEIIDSDALLPEISRQLIEKASKESMSKMMSSTTQLVNMLRFIPLFIKAPIASLVYGFLGDRIFSSTLSNLGVVELPDELSSQVESMDFVLGSSSTNRASCAMVTFNNVATLSISKMTTDPTFEEALNRLLITDGIIPSIEGSELYES